MPALSPTMTSGNIGQFQKQIGDSIQSGDVLCEIETDKAQMDFELQEEGYLAKILMPEGTKEAEVGRPLAIIVSKKEDVKAFENYKEGEAIKSENTNTKELKPTQSPPEATIITPNTTTEHPSDRIKASPLAKKLATEKGINLSDFKGTGPNGRIIKNDIINSSKQSHTPTLPIPSSSASFIDVPLSGMRKVIANRLTQSKQDIPHYYLSVEIKMDKIMELRSKFNSTSLLQETFGEFKLSINDFIVKAAALSLKQVPECNSSWHGDFIRQYSNVDICVAVATPSGLITPIVPAADSKGLVAISSKVKELAGKAKINKLKPEEYQGGTFTISNLGMYGVDSFTAIINPPQSCILAVGATKPSDDNTFNKMTVTLSCDHRVVDGARGASWLAHFKKYLEEPEQMIL